VMAAAQAEKKVLIKELRELRQQKTSRASSCSAGQKPAELCEDRELPEVPRRRLQSVPVHSAMDDLEEEGSGQSSNDAGVAQDLDIVEDVEDWEDEDVLESLPTRASTGGASGSLSSVPEPPPKPGAVLAPKDDDPRLFVDAHNLLSESGSTGIANGTENDVCVLQDIERSDNEKSDKSEEKDEEKEEEKSGAEDEGKAKGEKDDFIAQLQASLRKSPSSSLGGSSAGGLGGSVKRVRSASILGAGSTPTLGIPKSPAGSKRASWGGEEKKEFGEGEPIEKKDSEKAPEAPPPSVLKKRSSTTGHLGEIGHHHHHKKDHKKRSSVAQNELPQLPELPGNLKALDLSMDHDSHHTGGRRSYDLDHKRGSGGGAHSGRMSLDVTSMRHNELFLHPALQLVPPDQAMQGSRRVTWCGDGDPSQPMYATTIHTPPQPAVVEEEEVEEEVIEMLSIWKMRRKSTTAMSSNRQLRGHRNSLTGNRQDGLKRSSKADLELEMEDTEPEWTQNVCCRRFSRMVAKPSSAKRLLWDIFGVFLIGYDLVWIPMQAFDPAKATFTEFMAWLTTCFWTLDIPCSFLVGYHREGVLEMRISRIARHYMRTWFPFDMIVISVDWSLSLVDIVSEQALKGSGVSSMGYMRLAKAVRFLRLLRLLRLLKAHGVVSELIDRIQSESHLIIVGIVKLLVFIMMVNHLIACVWYGIGSAAIDGDRNWPEVAGVMGGERTLAYKYLTSLHWSLTQFTPASMEVVPENELERAFTVVIILTAMIVFSSFVSAITNAMTQLRNLNSERNEQFSSLRRYLGENKCSTALMGRIWTCVQTAMGRTKRRVHETDVKVLQMLPWSLKAELLEEVYNPILAAHPFFMQFSSSFHQQMRKILQNAIEEISLPIGQELFSSGEAANNMYFVLSGVMVYTKDNKSSCEPPCFVSAGQWVSEAALWIKWKHNGQLIGTTPCELIALKVAKVQEVLTQMSYDEDQVKRYVKIFVRYFKKNPDSLTDVWAETDLLTDMAHKAFMGEEDDEEGMQNPNRLHTQQTGGGFSFMAQRRQSVNPGRMMGGGLSASNPADRSRRQSIFAGGLGGLFGMGGRGGPQPGLEAASNDSDSSSDSDSETDESGSGDEDDEENEEGTIAEGDEDDGEGEENEDSEGVNKRKSKDSRSSEEDMEKKDSANTSVSLTKKESLTNTAPRRTSKTSVHTASGRRTSNVGLTSMMPVRRMSLGMGARRPSVTGADISKLPQSVLDAMANKDKPANNNSRRPSVTADAGNGSRRPSTMDIPTSFGDAATHCLECGNIFMADAIFCRKCGARRADKDAEKASDTKPALDLLAQAISPIPKGAGFRGSLPVEGTKPLATARGSMQELDQGASSPSSHAEGRKNSAEDFGPTKSLDSAKKARKRSSEKSNPENGIAHVSSTGGRKRQSLQSNETAISDVSMGDDEIDNFLERCKHKKRSSDLPLEEPEEPQSLPLKLLNALRTSDGGENVRRNSKNAALPFASRSSTGSSRGEPVGNRISTGSTRSRNSKPMDLHNSCGSVDAGVSRSTGKPFIKRFMGMGSKTDGPTRKSEGDAVGQPVDSDFKPATSGRFGGWFSSKKSQPTRESAKKAIFPSS